jgi:hypothetical protein
MDSSFSPKDEIWFLRVCHHISNAVYISHSPTLKLRLSVYKSRRCNMTMVTVVNVNPQPLDVLQTFVRRLTSNDDPVSILWRVEFCKCLPIRSLRSLIFKTSLPFYVSHRKITSQCRKTAYNEQQTFALRCIYSIMKMRETMKSL